MKDNSTAQLLPCPFCGGEAQRFTIGEDEPNNAGGDVICCTRCQASSHVEFGRKENLVSRWNARAPVSQDAAQLVERLRRYASVTDSRPHHEPGTTLHHALAEAADLIEALTRVQPSTGLDMGAQSLIEALTPSAETKAAYMGEFSFTIEVSDDTSPETDYVREEEVAVPWTTIKEIMAAIRARALQGDSTK